MKDSQKDTLIAHGVRWTKLQQTQRWEPEIGESIHGAFLGLKHKKGMYGEYKCCLIQTVDGVRSITGITLIDAIENSAIQHDDLIRIVYKGNAISGTTLHEWKVFEIFVAEKSMQHREERIA